MPPEQEHCDAAGYQFVAALGGAMAAANYPVTMVGETTAATSRAHLLENQILALPNYVHVASPTDDDVYIANPGFDLRYDQSFPLAKLVARAPSGAANPDEGMTELERIRNQQRRFPVRVTVLGYAKQSTGLALIRQPTARSLVDAAHAAHRVRRPFGGKRRARKLRQRLRRRADRAAAVARCDSADVGTEPEGHA